MYMIKQRIIIIGAGFAGVTAMQKLAESKLFDITLISPNMYFEYYPGLYRIMSNHIPFEVFVPMRYLISKGVSVISEKVDSFDSVAKTVTTESGLVCAYDTLIIASGTQPTDFGIAGVRQYAQYVTSLPQMLQSKNELLERLQMHLIGMSGKPFTVIIAGAGPTGVELSGELTELFNRFAKKHRCPREKFIIKVIQRDATILPQLPETVREKATARLQKIGVELLLENTITAVHKDMVTTDKGSYSFDMFFWSAGSTQTDFIRNNTRFVLSPRKKVVVDATFLAQGFEGVYVLGDNAETQFSGLAQIAEQDGAYVARVLIQKQKNETVGVYTPRKPIYVIPIGDYFGILGAGKYIFSGIVPWVLRYAVDMRFFFFALPFRYFMKLSIRRKLK